MNKKATIYDLKRMCLAHKNCITCPLDDYDCSIKDVGDSELEEMNTVILDWCESHPIKTRLTEFKKMFPHCKLGDDGYPEECVCLYDMAVECLDESVTDKTCTECCRRYWDEEIK